MISNAANKTEDVVKPTIRLWDYHWFNSGRILESEKETQEY